jgi:exonuclease I
MNSGMITRIDRKHLRELLENDPKLLDEYNNETRKDKKLKEYLIRYLQSKIDE